MGKKKVIELLKVCGMTSTVAANLAENDEDWEKNKDLNFLILDIINLNRLVAEILGEEALN